MVSIFLIHTDWYTWNREKGMILLGHSVQVAHVPLGLFSLALTFCNGEWKL